jgi:hypothetical protein
VQPGVPAPTGQPTSLVFNGLTTVLDASARFPLHAVPAAAGTLPAALASPSLPHVQDIRVLARRDAVILYFASVAGAADYRAYAVSNAVSFVDTPNGRQPRRALISCAGYRQHPYAPATPGRRELMQAIELPGFVAAGNYTIVLEATRTPCPFTGLPGHTDATFTGVDFHRADPATYRYSALHYAKIVSRATQLAQYGNEILNGHGSTGSWANRLTQRMGLTVPAGDATLPSDPVAIARSAIAVQLPFFDESFNAPVFDVGPNSVVDDFPNDLVAAPTTIRRNPDYPLDSNAAPLVDIPGEWSFWGRYMQHADGEETQRVNGTEVYPSSNYNGFQVFQRHGRLYTTFGDAGQDIGGSMAFASLKTAPQELDATKYVHSMFRVNSEATHRRYWTWTLCGGATRAELQDPVTRQYRVRPIFYETSFDAGGGGPGLLYADNPSMPAPRLAALTPAQARNASAKECLSIAQEGRPEIPGAESVIASGSTIRAQIHPAGLSKGVIALGNRNSDITSYGFRYRLNASGTRVGPMVEPGDQTSPLTHFDFFVRPDRLVVFINGRQGFCVDLSDRPLTMRYGMISYGDLIYHSSLEWQEVYNERSSQFHVLMNSPIASTRAWDFVGHAEKIDIPSQFASFDPTLCRKPASIAVQ